jgi:CBS domain-containing protein
MHEQGMARRSAVPIPRQEPLSPESAASVREGAIAVLHHGVRYLPVVDDGTLVGLVAVGELDRLRPDPGQRATRL